MRLIVVDDDRLVVDSLKIILGAQPQIEVVGTGANGNDGAALRLLLSVAGDVQTRSGLLLGLVGLDQNTICKRLQRRHACLLLFGPRGYATRINPFCLRTR